MNLTEEYTVKKIQKEKATKNLTTSYDLLCKQHAKLDKKFQDLFKEFKDIKGKAEIQDRELIKKQKTIENLIEEKCELNQLLANNKNLIRKLESKIVIGSKGASDLNLNKQVQILTQEKHAIENELNSAYDKLQDLEDHISVISKALELKAEDMKVNVDKLLTLAENRENVYKFKDKETMYEVKIEELQISLDQAFREIEKLQNSNEKYISETLSLEKKLSTAINEKKNSEQVRFIQKFFQCNQENKSLLEYIDELNQSISSHKPLKKQKDNKKILEEKQCEIEELQMKYNQIESKLLEYEREKSLDSENSYQKDSLHKKNKKIHELEELLSKKNEEILGLKMKEHELCGKIESFNDKEEPHQESDENLLRVIEELRDEREQLKEAMNEAINQCAASLIKQQNLEKDNQKLLKQVENLANSKLLLQNTMADQINSLRGQVQRLKEEKNDKSIKVSN